MTRRLRNETGSTLIAAVLIVFIMLAFGLSLLAASDTQSKTSTRDRTRESSFNLAEGVMNAHVLQLTRSWPTAANPSTACTPTSGTNTTCPQPSAIDGGYVNGDYGTPCASSPATTQWQTMVRDSQGEQYWSASYVTSRQAYDSNGDGVVWVRSQATTQCHTIAVVSQVTSSQIPITFPTNVVTANWFQTTNSGKKVIVDTRGSGSQPAPIVARCAGMTTAQCLNYPANKGQVQPPAVRSDSSASATTLSTAQLLSLETQARASNSYYDGCPTAAQLSSPSNGAPVYVKSCNISVGSNTQINTAAKPGALVVETGTFSIGGTANFYGLLYMVNKQATSGAVVTISGSAQIYGIVSVDGLGGIVAGSSKTNLVNDPRASTLLKGTSGATVNKNTFRIVPTS